MANVRLPLRPLIYLGGKEAFNQVLKDEIQPENFEAWVESARSEKHVFKQSPDVICVQAAQNAVQASIKRDSTTSSGQWKSVLGQVEKCLRAVSDQAKAVATAHWIINRSVAKDLTTCSLSEKIM